MVAGMDSRKRSGPPIHSHVSSATIKNEKLTKTFCPSIFSITLLGLLNLLGELPTGGWSLLFPFLFYAPVYTLTPRFILKIRELYAHKAQDTRGEEIDNGFGLSTVGSGVIETEIAFADLPNEGFEDDVLGTGWFGLSSSGRGTIETAAMCADVERNERLEVVEVSRATGTTRPE